jgi:NADH-quinone oxidoreductase subunit M
VFSAVYMLWMFQRVNYGPVTNDKNSTLGDLDRREWIVVAPIVIVAVLMGILPNLFLRPIEASAARVVGQVRAEVPNQIQAAVRQSR